MFLFIQQADDVMKIVTARELTIGGILLAMCIYLGWRLYKKEGDYKEMISQKDQIINQLQKDRFQDRDRYAEKYASLAERQFTHLQQLSTLVKG